MKSLAEYLAADQNLSPKFRSVFQATLQGPGFHAVARATVAAREGREAARCTPQQFGRIGEPYTAHNG